MPVEPQDQNVRLTEAPQPTLEQALAQRDTRLGTLARQYGFIIKLGQGEKSTTYFFVPMGEKGAGTKTQDILLTTRANSPDIFQTTLLRQGQLRTFPFSVLSHAWPDANPNEAITALAGRIRNHSSEAMVTSITPIPPENTLTTFKTMAQHIKTLKKPATNRLPELTQVNDIINQI